MKKVSIYVVTAMGVMALGLVSPKEASAGDLRVSVHFGIPVIVQPPPVVYRPVVVHQPVGHVRHPHRRHHGHRHLRHHVHAGWRAPAQPIVMMGMRAHLR